MLPVMPPVIAIPASHPLVNWGLFAMLCGFLLPIGLALRLLAQAVWERGRGLRHPLVLGLLGQALLAAIPAVALVPSVISVCGRPNAAGELLLEYAATGWGAVKLAVTFAAVLLVDLTMPRVCAQLATPPVTSTWVTGRFLARDTGVIVTVLLLAWIAAQ